MGTTSEERSPASQEVQISLGGPTSAHLSSCRSSLHPHESSSHWSVPLTLSCWSTPLTARFNTITCSYSIHSCLTFYKLYLPIHFKLLFASGRLSVSLIFHKANSRGASNKKEGQGVESVTGEVPSAMGQSVWDEETEQASRPSVPSLCPAPGLRRGLWPPPTISEKGPTKLTRLSKNRLQVLSSEKTDLKQLK